MKKNRWLIILIILNIMFIWGNSIMNPEQSHNISQFVYEILGKLFNLSRENLPIDNGEHFLRKAAHFFEFMVLGILMTTRFGRLNIKNNVVIIVIGVIVASCDETIQIFSNRGSSVKDVMIDTVGFVIGLIFITTVFYIKKRKIKNHNANF